MDSGKVCPLSITHSLHDQLTEQNTSHTAFSCLVGWLLSPPPGSK